MTYGHMPIYLLPGPSSRVITVDPIIQCTRMRLHRFCSNRHYERKAQPPTAFQLAIEIQQSEPSCFYARPWFLKRNYSYLAACFVNQHFCSSLPPYCISSDLLLLDAITNSPRYIFIARDFFILEPQSTGKVNCDTLSASSEVEIRIVQSTLELLLV